MSKLTIIGRDQHGISRDQISTAAQEVVDRLQRGGYEAYVVGGCVRDLLLGKQPKDFDVATNATPEQIEAQFEVCRLIGRRFRLAHVRIDRETVEVATFRAAPADDVKSGDHVEGSGGQLTRDNVYGNRDQDAERRDFTVNALYFDPSDETIIDYVGGMQDIERRLLRSLGDPKVRFREDPVRMLRILRFAAKLEFDMDPAAEVLIADMGKLLNHVPPARMFEETLKLFHGGAALKTFELLREYQLFRYMFPFTEQCLSDSEPGLPERALANTDVRVKQGKPVIPPFLFACMLWDPVREDAAKLLATGVDPNRAWKIAMDDIIRDQCQYVAIPRRLAAIIIEIWSLQARMATRKPRTIRSSLGHRRFRAAYDFLLLRAALNEIDSDIADWWTRIQEVDGAEQAAMIDTLDRESRGGRRRPQGARHQRSGHGNNGQFHRHGSYGEDEEVNGNTWHSDDSTGNQRRGGRRKPTGNRGRRQGNRQRQNSRQAQGHNQGQNQGQSQGRNQRRNQGHNHGQNQEYTAGKGKPHKTRRKNTRAKASRSGGRRRAGHHLRGPARGANRST